MELNVVIENISNEYGGPANSLPNFLNAIHNELGVESTIFSTVSSNAETNEFIDRFSIPWVRCEIDGFDKVKYSRELKRQLAGSLTAKDVLFSNNLWNYPAFLAAQLAKQNGIPHIISIRGTLYPWSLAQGALRKKLAWYLFQKKSLQQASLIHVTCADEYKAVRELNITTPIAIVPHGINFDDYQDLPNKADALEYLNVSKDKKYVLFMSRLHKKKGLDLLLDIWPALAKQFPDWCLLVAGPDYSDYTSKIASLAIEHNIVNNIKTLGMLTGEGKRSALAASQFFVLPTHSENFGVVVGEALAAGLPVITTTGTPWSDIASYGCGQYIELSKTNLLHSMQKMMTLDDESLTEMSGKAKQLIKRDYSWSAQAKKFGQALGFVLNGETASDVVFLHDESPPDHIL